MRYIMFFLLVSSVYATDYYVKNSGNDNLDGRSDATAWKTLERVNSHNFQPGDTIQLKAGDVWYEHIEVTWSGTQGNPITITRYGTGDNPLISTGDLVTSWTREKLGSGQNSDIYSFNTKAVDSDWVNPFGVIINDRLAHGYWYNTRTTSEYYSAPTNNYLNPEIDILQSKMKDGYSWSPMNAGKIFVKSTSGSPGATYVGRRKMAIYGEQKDYITIDGIALQGPSGGGQGNYATLIGLIDCDSCEYLTVRNCILKNNMGGGIIFGNGGNYALIEDNQIEWTWNGISGMGNTGYVTVRGNTLKNIGAHIPSIGDRGPIATWGHHWLIENNYIENHGWEGQADSELVDTCTSATLQGCQIMDRAITSCCGHLWGGESGYHIIRNNYLKNIGSGGVTMYSGGHNEIYNNIIDGWNLAPPNHMHPRGNAIDSTYLHSLKEKGLDSHADVKIFNNVITGGKKTQTEDVAIRCWNDHDNLEVKNNIVFGNDPGILAFSHWQGFDLSTAEIQNNIFDIPSGNVFLMEPNFYTSIAAWESAYASSSRYDFSGNMDETPELDGDFYPTSGSNLIDAGVALGSPYNIDIDGTSRPQGSGWDIGAYEYTDSSPCVEDWACSDWSEWSDCIDNIETRTMTCTDRNSCGTTVDKPNEEETRACNIGDLRAYWKMDSTADSSGNGNILSLHGSPALASGIDGNAFRLDGDDYISADDSASLDFDKSQGTITMWVKPDSVTAGTRRLLFVDSDFEMEYNIMTDGLIYFYPYADHGTWDNVNKAADPIDSDWQMVAVTWDYSTKSAVLYRDGVEIDLSREDVPVNWDTIAQTGDWHIGGSPVKPGEYFIGLIDEVKVYSKVLTSNEILTAYQELSCIPGDSDCSGCVNMQEMLNYIESWRQGSVQLENVVLAINSWLNC